MNLGSSRKASLWAKVVAWTALMVSAEAMASPQLLAPPAVAESPVPSKVGHDPSSPFSLQEMRAFVAAAAKADQIKDPLERCLRFPAPPGSHWTPESIDAYCHYMFQPAMELAEFERLVTSHRAKEVDERFAKWTSESTTHPDAFWHFLMNNLNTADPSNLALVESWKQQVPDSAFAHTAAGLQYVLAGKQARGGEVADKTPEKNMQAMATQVDRALGDLELANRLNPRLSATYAVMVQAGTLSGDPAYAADAGKKGLAASAEKFPILYALVTFVSDRWYGNQALQDWLINQAREAAGAEPVAWTTESRVLSDRAGLDYRPPQEPLTWSVYREAFDHVSNFSTLAHAGGTAQLNGQYDVAYVYLSEASRFNVANASVNDGRAQSLFVVRETLDTR